MNPDIAKLRHQLKQLQELHEAGTLDDAQYAQSKAGVERKLLDLVLADPAAAAAPAVAAAPEAAAGAPADTGPKPSKALLFGLGGAVVVVAAAGYFFMGSPSAVTGGAAGGPMTGAAAPGGEEGAASAPHPLGTDQIAGMIDKLAQRLKDKPDDVDGWAMLARSYAVSGKHADAVAAFKKAYALRKDDPVLLADYADALAMTQDRDLAGEPTTLIEAALKLDDKNVKALSLAGTAAFNKKDYVGALKHWEKLTQVAPKDSVFVQQIQGGIEEARQLAGIKAPPAAASGPLIEAATGKGAAPAAAGGAKVSGTVTLAAALAKDASPEDTVFVFARATDGPPMPLAILRKQVKDLPLEFTLDDSLSMSPAARISGASKVIVGARVSKSGNAMPQPGDLQGAAGPLAVGTTGIALQISERRN